MNNKRTPKSLSEIIENSWAIILFILGEFLIDKLL